MKKLLLIAAIGIASIATMPAAKAQVSLSVGLNLGARPDWGPSGYDRAAYYYMPDIGAYYDVPSEEFIYLDGGTWRRSHGLPGIYGDYDYRHGRMIVVNSASPWRHNNVYVGRYGRPTWGGRGGYGGRGYAGRGYGGRGYNGGGFRGGDHRGGGFDRGHGNGGFHGNAGGGFHGNPGGNHGGGNPGGGQHGGGNPGGGQHGGGGGHDNHGGGGHRG